MGLFVLIGRDGARGGELRKQHRDAHLANLRPLAEAGRVVYAGPLLDDAEQPCGSVIVFEAEDLAAAGLGKRAKLGVHDSMLANSFVSEKLQ